MRELKHVAQPGCMTYCGLSPDDPANADIRAYDLCSLPDNLNAAKGWCPTCIEEVKEETTPPEAIWSGRGDITDVAIEGRCVIVDKYREFWAKDRGGKDYRSPMLNNPTWEDLLAIATEVIRTTGDWHHVFLETIEEVKEHELETLAASFSEEPKYRVFTLGLGS